MYQRDTERMTSIVIFLVSIALTCFAPVIGCSHYAPVDETRDNTCSEDTTCKDGLFCDETNKCVAATVLEETMITKSMPMDVLFVLDNSKNMARWQKTFAESFSKNSSSLQCIWGKDIHVTVITTGIESRNCPMCSDEDQFSCINDTGENGALQNRLGHYEGDLADPHYGYVTSPHCPPILDSSNLDCLYDSDTATGMLLTGNNGCGYERGLEAMRMALSGQSGFLRKDAMLLVLVLSDEQDCGSVEDIEEGLSGVGGDACYYASKGTDPEGNKVNELSPVKEYYDFLTSLKDGQKGMVKFLAFVGMQDPDDPSSTKIEYESSPDGGWDIKRACEMPQCTDKCDADDSYCLRSCSAYPGTRYIELARMFGDSGFADTICKQDYFDSIQCTFAECPSVLKISKPVERPEYLRLYLNGVLVPSYSCAIQSQPQLVSCGGPTDQSCPDDSACVPSWTYGPPVGTPPDPEAEGGYIKLAEHFRPCEMTGYAPELKFQIVLMTHVENN